MNINIYRVTEKQDFESPVVERTRYLQTPLKGGLSFKSEALVIDGYIGRRRGQGVFSGGGSPWGYPEFPAQPVSIHKIIPAYPDI